MRNRIHHVQPQKPAIRDIYFDLSNRLPHTFNPVKVQMCIRDRLITTPIPKRISTHILKDFIRFFFIPDVPFFSPVFILRHPLFQLLSNNTPMLLHRNSKTYPYQNFSPGLSQHIPGFVLPLHDSSTVSYTHLPIIPIFNLRLVSIFSSFTLS